MTAAAPSAYALIVAAGRGVRAGGGVPKQYRPVGGKPLISWSLEAYATHPAIAGIVVAIAPDDEARFAAIASDGPWTSKLLAPILGGAARQDSVRAGLEALADRGADAVLIHDAARPFVSAGLIDRVLAGLKEAPGALPVLPVSDTLKRGQPGGIVKATIARDGLWRAQTPQGFDFRAILAAHRKAAGQRLTDDAAVAEAAGLAVKLVAGDARNIKITEPEDFALAEAMMGASSPAPAAPATITTGQGFDVHRLGPGDGVWLCGIKIPGEIRLIGHSDADAGLHALTDAILGAIGADDIGAHFPPTDERWRDAASDKFLLHALKLMRERGGTLLHFDITLICERPKIGPHRAAMRARLAELTGLPVARCSVKATTTEGLGFTGRGEGLAAQAVATVAFERA